MDQELRALIEAVIKLSGFKVKEDGPASLFLRDLDENFPVNPMDHRAVIMYDCMVEVSRSVNDRNSMIHIADIRSMNRGNGDSSKALKYLCDLADHVEVDLELFAKAYVKDALTTKQLVAWYSRYGFVEDGFPEDDAVDMVRRHHS